MRLTGIALDRFRNLATASLEIPPGGAVLVGANGQGKTNLLEAIHYLARFRSFRGTAHRDAIAFGEERFVVDGRVARDDGRARRVRVVVEAGRRRIGVDGQAPVRPHDAVGVVSTVLLEPADLALVTGSPGGRRRYLDTLLGLPSRRYRSTLTDYERTLRQRNELLKRRSPEPGALATWDEALVRAGAPIVAARARLVRELDGRFDAIAAAIAGQREPGFGLAYRPSVEVEPAVEGPAIAAAWIEALAASRERDRARGWTTVGPHADELAIEADGRALGRFGSQGEGRTAVVALKLLEAEILERETGERPILLLDDVFTELDPPRAARLVAWLGGRHQRFVTTPRPLPEIDGGLARWDVDGGRIEIRREAA